MQILEVDYVVTLRSRGTVFVPEEDYLLGLDNTDYMDRIIMDHAEEKIDDRKCSIEVEWS